jgi:hypothetical protein
MNHSVLEKKTFFQGKITEEIKNAAFRFVKKWYMAFKFEKLIAWQKAVDLSEMVHNISRAFSKEEIYILTSQVEKGR